MTADSQTVEDLYTKIALENKLVTRFQVRKAAEELEALAKDGQKVAMGDVMVRLGFLSERQHQSVINACRYREQRDYDKRFGRQCLRMELLEQKDIEAALEVQKEGYGANGAVTPLADILVTQQRLTQAKVDEVKKGIDERDKAKTLGKSQKGQALGASATGLPAAAADEKGGDAPTKIVPRPAEPAAAAPAKAAPADAEADDGTDDVDLDDVDLDDVDLDDVDLEGVDLDEDLDEDEDEAGDEDEADEDEADEDEADEDEDEDDAAPAAPAGEDELDLDLKGVEPGDLDGDEDEKDLADDVSELGSDVELDDEDLKALDAMDSGDEVKAAEEWAQDAFDDRPISQRPPSDRLTPPPPRPLPAPATPAAPTRPPVPPKAAGATSARVDKGKPAEATAAEAKAAEAKAAEAKAAEAKAAEAKAAEAKAAEAKAAEAKAAEARRPAPKGAPEAAVTSSAFETSQGVVDAPVPPPRATAGKPAAKAEIPGGDVFGESGDRVKASRPPSSEEELTASEVGRLIDATTSAGTSTRGPALGDLEPEPSEERPARARSDRLATSARQLDDAIRDEELDRTLRSVQTAPRPTPPQARPAGLDLDDPRVKRAFERAVQAATEAAWRAFRDALGDGK